MSVRRALARATTPALAGLAISGLVASGLSGALPSAQATASAPTGLHVTGSVNIGKGSNSFVPSFGEAPNGAVYFSLGRKVYVVNGTSAPVLRVTTSGNVLAVAANSTDFFVDVSRTVTAYQRSNGAKLRQWKLRSPRTPTAAGLYAVGDTVWAWTDSSTDSSGLEYANISRFSTSSAAVHKVSYGVAYPFTAAANSTGLYFEAVTSKGTNGYLEHVTPAGGSHRVKDVNLPGELALAGSRVEILAIHLVHGGARFYIYGYSATKLVRVFSRRVPSAYVDIAGTNVGLLAVIGCNPSPCPVKVSQLSTVTGARIRSVGVPNAIAVLAGGKATVIGYTTKTNTYFLARLAG